MVHDRILHSIYIIIIQVKGGVGIFRVGQIQALHATKHNLTVYIISSNIVTVFDQIVPYQIINGRFVVLFFKIVCQIYNHSIALCWVCYNPTISF